MLAADTDQQEIIHKFNNALDQTVTVKNVRQIYLAREQESQPITAMKNLSL